MRLAHDPMMRMLMDNFMNQEHETERKCHWMPATNITETEQAFRMREFGLGNFCRSFSLPESIDKDAIKAEYLNGILMITLPKMEVVKTTKEIQVA